MNRSLPVFVFGALIGFAGISATRAAVPGQEPTQSASKPPDLGDGWITSAPEQAQIDPRRLEQLTAAIKSLPEYNVHALLIERDGRLVYEQYFSGQDQRWGQPLGVVRFTRSTLHDLRSMTKSVVSALVGIAHNSGAIPSLDAPLLDYFPEYTDLQVTERRRITIRHALSMSAGLEWNEDIPYTDPKNDEIAMYWNGRQVIPRAWVHESTRRQITISGNAVRGYAYHWWHACYTTPSGVIEVPMTVGNGEQRIFLLRAQRTVVTVLSGRYNDFSANPAQQLLLEFIVPALPSAPKAACPS